MDTVALLMSKTSQVLLGLRDEEGFLLLQFVFFGIPLCDTGLFVNL